MDLILKVECRLKLKQAVIEFISVECKKINKAIYLLFIDENK